jgi:hypothetical protein
MIRLLRQKAIDKEAQAKDRMLGEREIELFNRLEARGEPDKERYNKEIYKQYLSKFVQRGANMKKHRLAEMIKPNYVTQEQVKKMIDDKYRQGNFNIKSEEEIKKLYEVGENVFNNMEDPQNSLNTVSAKDYNRVLVKKLYEISSNVSAEQLNSIINDNIKTENEFELNVPSQSSSHVAFPSSFKEEEEEKLPGEGDGESEDDTDNETIGGESSN